ncbi:autophagy-related protein 16 [Apodospora peruviana]|uniref:Autophagy-related protein 16 n=1 Tax=Apodospora peruviana TaxID=516989 RepID=A0AAE0IBS3_9PEZI|nr:autophagy-related protein 16 [Apodospora peruviana]
MPSWRDEFLSGIRDSERRNPMNRDLVEACSHLADRVAALETENEALQNQINSQIKGQAPKGKTTEPTTTDDSAVATRLRLDLAEALRAKGHFQNRLQLAEDELARLRSKTSSDSQMLRELTIERKKLTIKLRDREEELRAKNKLVADVQDELTVLNLQLNVVERRRKEKEDENKQLVERFMKRVGQEADAMNLANEPLFNKKGDRAR